MPGEGWYDDLSDARMQRYWDGEHWTDSTRPRAAENRPTLSTDAEHIGDGGPSAEEVRQAEWQEGFPVWDANVVRDDEPRMPAETMGGATSYGEMYAARWMSRVTWRDLWPLWLVCGVMIVAVVLLLILS
jgi:hypothetical protein